MSTEMKRWERVDLNMTCGACPEQYDAFIDGRYVGYVRLRHGFFRVEDAYGNDIFATSDVEGDGVFESHERERMLKKARKAIAKADKKAHG